MILHGVEAPPLNVSKTMFDWFLDRTSELRNKGFTGRTLGPVQMTTDTAVRVTRLVVQQQGQPSPLPFRECLF